MMATFQLSLVISLAALVYAQHNSCYQAMDCVSKDIQNANYANDKAKICRLGPDVVKCVENHNKDCDDDFMATTNKQQIDIFKEALKNCDKILGVTSTVKPSEKMPIKRCTEHFTACVPQEFQDASEHKNKQVLCRLFPGVITCMENALLQCQNDDQPQIEMLSKQLTQMNNNFASSDCKKFQSSGNTGCNKDLSDCNQGNYLVTSIIHTCLAIIMAVLLH